MASPPTYDDAVYVFNKRAKHMLRMLKEDVPGDPIISMVKSAIKAVKAINRGYMYDVYNTIIYPRYSIQIAAKHPFFLDQDFMVVVPMTAWIVPYLKDVYNMIPEARREDYWREIHKLGRAPAPLAPPS